MSAPAPMAAEDAYIAIADAIRAHREVRVRFAPDGSVLMYGRPVRVEVDGFAWRPRGATRDLFTPLARLFDVVALPAGGGAP